MMRNTFLFVPLVLGIISDSVIATAIAAEKGVMAIFKTPALLEIQFTADDKFSTEDIYHIEEATTLYLQELLANDDSLTFLEEPDSLIDVSVNVQSQQVNGNEISLDSEVDIVHYGEEGITDVAALLTFLVNRNNTDSSSIYLDRIIQTDATIELISFDYISESTAMATNLTTTETLNKLKNSQKYGSEKTLIVVTTLLSITLFGMSAILIWVGGGWLTLRQKVQDLLIREEELTRMTRNIESKPTLDTDIGDEEDQNSPSGDNGSSHYTNPSGLLGVNGGSRPNIYGVKTPAKLGGGTTVDDHATPMSVMSDYSDTDRVPIGIMSMRKLVPPQHQDDSDEDRSNENIANNFNGMKKLEY